MCVTTAVEGRLTLRGDRTKDLNHLLTAEVSRKTVAGQETRNPYVPNLRWNARGLSVWDPRATMETEA